MPRKRPQVLGVDLNCSESMLAGPQSAFSHTRIAHGERLDGHVEEGCRTTRLYVSHVTPRRGFFGKALNLCRSAFASFGPSRWGFCPTRLLCPPRQGPRCCRAAEQREEIAAL